jgi:hypothetical protein
MTYLPTQLLEQNHFVVEQTHFAVDRSAPHSEGTNFAQQRSTSELRGIDLAPVEIVFDLEKFDLQALHGSSLGWRRRPLHRRTHLGSEILALKPCEVSSRIGEGFSLLSKLDSLRGEVGSLLVGAKSLRRPTRDLAHTSSRERR